MMDLWVDTRWNGQHGIGRYSREVLSRLSMPWRSMELEGSPSSPTGVLARVPKGIVYSPGYNAFARAERQVLTIHDLIHLQTPWPGRAKYLAYYNSVVKPVVRKAGVVITVSETSRRTIAQWLEDDSVEIVNAGLGASSAFHADVEPAPSNAPYLMYVGNLRAHKNVCVVLDAMAMLPSARLRMLVPWREHDDAYDQLTERGISERVDLLAGLTDHELASHYRGAVATVMPSTLEGFGLPALESIMTGTPVIYWAGCRAVAETVADSGTPVNSAHDEAEWAGAIQATLNSQLRVASPHARYDWGATAASVERVLQRL